jgi:hypothetical protein
MELWENSTPHLAVLGESLTIHEANKVCDDDKVPVFLSVIGGTTYEVM